MKLYAYALTLGLVAGVALGHIYDGGRVGPSPVLLYEDAAALVPDPTPMAYGVKGRATWYAARCPDGVAVLFLGRRDTCTPYVSKKHGGRGGERYYYGAVGWWRWGMTPVAVELTSLRTGRSVVVIVRDYCKACDEGRVLIDISPMAFLDLGLTLGTGVARIELRYLAHGR